MLIKVYGELRQYRRENNKALSTIKIDTAEFKVRRLPYI